MQVETQYSIKFRQIAIKTVLVVGNVIVEKLFLTSGNHIIAVNPIRVRSNGLELDSSGSTAHIITKLESEIKTTIASLRISVACEDT